MRGNSSLTQSLSNMKPVACGDMDGVDSSTNVKSPSSAAMGSSDGLSADSKKEKTSSSDNNLRSIVSIKGTRSTNVGIWYRLSSTHTMTNLARMFLRVMVASTCVLYWQNLL